jgi:hypothetical protein
MPTQSGKPVMRLPAPDATGGYSQPVRLVWNDTLTFTFERLTCASTGVSLDVAQAYRDARRPNLNPHLLPIVYDVQGSPVDLDAVVPGATVSFSEPWSAESAEAHVSVDGEHGALATRTETPWLACFTSGNTLEHDFAAPRPGDTSTVDRWQAPSQSGTYYLWTVLHGNRGGVDFAEMRVTVMERDSVVSSVPSPSLPLLFTRVDDAFGFHGLRMLDFIPHPRLR